MAGILQKFRRGQLTFTSAADDWRPYIDFLSLDLLKSTIVDYRWSIELLQDSDGSPRL